MVHELAAAVRALGQKRLLVARQQVDAGALHVNHAAIDERPRDVVGFHVPERRAVRGAKRRQPAADFRRQLETRRLIAHEQHVVRFAERQHGAVDVLFRAPFLLTGRGVEDQQLAAGMLRAGVLFRLVRFVAGGPVLLGERTVETHLTHIYAKLGVQTGAQAVETRVKQFGAVVDVVQSEAEEILLDAASTAHGVHAAAEVLRSDKRPRLQSAEVEAEEDLFTD